MNIKEKIKDGFLFFDGGTGTVLQSMGLKAGSPPEEENVNNPRLIIDLHKKYIDAGADIIKTNTFGINRLKFGERTEKLVISALNNAKTAVKECGKETYIALDIGPSGKLLKPLGDLEFEDAVTLFGEVVRIGAKNGADLVLIETMNDSYETKAAVLAAKENCTLPVFVTNVYDESGKMMTGCDPLGMTAMLEGLNADAIGLNCGFGPDKMKKTVETLYKYASVPIIVNPNAGLPRVENGETVFDIDPDTFAMQMKEIAMLGGRILGGCCGTTPEHIKRAKKAVSDLKPLPITEKNYTVVSSYTHGVIIGDKPILIGERINPTGKPRFKEALRQNNTDYILNEAVSQQEKGVHILDVNVGLPEIDEPAVMESSVKAIQAVSDLPLQIDTSNFEAMERAMRIYNGKPMVNSVNAKKESMEKIFPLIKKYGGVCVALTLSEEGIPETADGRVEIAERIYKTAEKYGISKKNIVVDTLAMTISSDTKNANVTLDALSKVRRSGVNTVLGVSNISFGLPSREYINSAFFIMALQKGLSCGIINPYSKEMMYAAKSFSALADRDESCLDFIGFASALPSEKQETKTQNTDLKTAVIKGFCDLAGQTAAELLKTEKPLKVINEYIIPALDEVGKGFEAKTVFLPSLLMSAEAAQKAFDVIKEKMSGDNSANVKKGKIILATVKDDIHDIGKNIVKVLLSNYGFDVIDLGKDVPPEVIVEKAMADDVPIVGLSALMTTTVSSMEQTIKALRKAGAKCKIVVGGAVLTQEYADMIGADKYARDAMETVRYAEEILG